MRQARRQIQSRQRRERRMNKAEFLTDLRTRLEGLPEEEIKKSVDFYGEMIADRMDDGLSEEEAVAALGDIKDITGRILADVPLGKIVKEKVKKVQSRRGLKPWEIVLLVLGSPVWLPVTLSLAIVEVLLFLVFYLVFWIIILVFYLVDLCIALGGVAGIVYGIALMVKGMAAQGLMILGGGIFCGGLSIPFFFFCNIVAKGMINLSRMITRGIKSLFVGRRKKGEQ